MSIVTQDFVAAGKPFYIVANAGVKYTDITDGVLYQQTTIPFGKNWKIISKQNVFSPSGSGVTTVTASTPLQSSGGNTPNLSIPQAGPSSDGYLSSADWNTFNAGSGTTPSALTKTNDTNVTLALTGTPNSALLQAVNIAVGWSGTLADGRIASASTWNSKVGSVGATAPITSSGGTTPTISTSMATNKLIGRSTAGTGVMEEISVGTGLSLSGGTLSATTQTVGYEMNFLLMGG